MNEEVVYTFRSASSRTVTIKSRLGEEAARAAAMKHLWGPAVGAYAGGYAGRGLDLVTIRQEEEGKIDEGDRHDDT